LNTLPISCRLVLEGDALQRLKELPNGGVDCIVTSTPYFGLRDYRTKGQIGLEPTWREHLNVLKAVFAEAKRVLSPWGSLWVNYGDTVVQHTRGKREGWLDDKRRHRVERSDADVRGKVPKQRDFPPGHKLGLNARLRLMLNDDLCWVSRDDVVWWKRNMMALSTKSRFSPKYEMVYRFVQRPRYHFDLNPVRKELAESTKKEIQRADAERRPFDARLPGLTQPSTNGNGEGRELAGSFVRSRGPFGAAPGSSPQSGHLGVGGPGDSSPKDHAGSLAQDALATKQRIIRGKLPRGVGAALKGAAPGQKPHSRNRFNVRVHDAQRGVAEAKWGEGVKASPDEIASYREGRVKTATLTSPAHPHIEPIPEDYAGDPAGANPGDVWDIPAAAPDWTYCKPCDILYQGAAYYALAVTRLEDGTRRRLCPMCGRHDGWVDHFAVFPKELVRRCLLSSCPREVCTACGKPRRTIEATDYVQTAGVPRAEAPRAGAITDQESHRAPGEGMRYGRATDGRRATGKTDCGCGAPFRPGVALDPFAGSFTTAIVAEELGLGWVGIDLNPDYVRIGQLRIASRYPSLASLFPRTEPRHLGAFGEKEAPA